MRNGVYAAISLAVAVIAATLALLLDGDSPSPTVTRPVTSRTAPDPRPSIPIPTRTPTPRVTVTPSPTPAPPPPPTPTPPSPGVLTLSPSSGVAVATPAPERTSEPPIPYGAFAAAGDASAVGSHALLMVEDGVTRTVATYEELRTESTVARFNVVDAEGESHAGRFDALAVGDLFEWRQAEDCWVRYDVTATPEPGARAATRDFGVRWMTYAFTGCSGPIASDAPVRVDLGPLPDLGNPGLAYPIRHGPWQLVPKDWEGPIEESEDRRPPWRYDRAPLPSTTLFHARQLPYWRDPELSGPWTLQLAELESASPYQYGYRAAYGTTTGVQAFTVSASVAFLGGERTPVECESVCHETRVIAGRPARISYSPPNPFNPSIAPAMVRVYDPETEARYMVRETDHLLLGGRIDEVIAIARSLFEPEPDRPGMLRYGHVDTLGTVAEPGSYAFLSGADASATAVDTFEGLRDGSATALLVHSADVDGTAHGDRFDALEAGDRFEWRRADDCWVRYRVTDVPPDPAGGGQRKLLGVQWETYAFTGCRSKIPVNAYASFDFNPLPNLGGTGLAVPVVHGPWQLVPEGWEGTSGVRTTTDRGSPGPSHESMYTGSGDLAVALAEPTQITSAFPDAWVFAGAYSGPLTDITSGSCARWNNAEGRPAVEICDTLRTVEYDALPASEGTGATVRETRTLGDRLALVTYSPPGPDHDPLLPVQVSVYDAATESIHEVFGYDPTLAGNNVDAVIEIARSLFRR
ncbi:MAG: hypothetical protein OXG95_04155 [Chloroflexi bacterium]|nr:hypothetical protein [Chloroflexota bacterium]